MWIPHIVGQRLPTLLLKVVTLVQLEWKGTIWCRRAGLSSPSPETELNSPVWLKPQIKCYTHTHTTALRPQCEMSLRARCVHWTKLTNNGTSHFTPWQGHTVGTHLLASPARRGALECDCILDILKREIRKLHTFPDQMGLCMKP